MRMSKEAGKGADVHSRQLSAVRLDPHIRWRKVGDEGVVLNQDKGEVLVLNALGTHIIELLGQGLNTGQLNEALLPEYNIDQPTLEADIQCFLHELVETGVANIL